MSGIETAIIGVVGAGQMGRGIAQIAALVGHRVIMVDQSNAALADAKTDLERILSRLTEKGRITKNEADSTSERLSFVRELDELAGCSLIIEAVVEQNMAKSNVFRALSNIVSSNTIIATNTSSLSINALSRNLADPARFLGLHFFNPVPLMRVVEVIPAATTNSATLATVSAFVSRLGHTAIHVADTPGFLVNHLGRAYVTEAFRLLEEQVAEPEVIDNVMTRGFGFKMGPFQLMDLTGLDVTQPATEAIFAGFYGEPRLRPSYLGAGRLAAGLLGRKAGVGFRTQETETAISPGFSGSVELAQPHDLVAGIIRRRLHACGVKIAGGAGNADLMILTSDGLDATSCACSLGANPAKSVVLSTRSLERPVWELSSCLATERAKADALAASMSDHTVTVSVLGESTGFIGDRILASVINLATDLAQKGIASPSDIDRASILALGYPLGPLAWGDRVAPRSILSTLDALHSRTGDPRYRASLWLRRRAELGVSLLTAAA